MSELSNGMRMINEDEIPGTHLGRVKVSEWRELLLSVPKGKALIIDKETAKYFGVSPQTCRQRLYLMRKDPELSRLKYVMRTNLQTQEQTFYVLWKKEGEK
jgi:hypothetical protein